MYGGVEIDVVDVMSFFPESCGPLVTEEAIKNNAKNNAKINYKNILLTAFGTGKYVVFNCEVNLRPKIPKNDGRYGFSKFTQCTQGRI